MCEEHFNDKNVISLPAFAISGNYYIDQQYLPSEFHSLVPCALSVQSLVMTSLFLQIPDWCACVKLEIVYSSLLNINSNNKTWFWKCVLKGIECVAIALCRRILLWSNSGFQNLCSAFGTCWWCVSIYTFSTHHKVYNSTVVNLLFL